MIQTTEINWAEMSKTMLRCAAAIDQCFDGMLSTLMNQLLGHTRNDISLLSETISRLQTVCWAHEINVVEIASSALQSGNYRSLLQACALARLKGLTGSDANLRLSELVDDYMNQLISQGRHDEAEGFEGPKLLANMIDSTPLNLAQFERCAQVLRLHSVSNIKAR